MTAACRSFRAELERRRAEGDELAGLAADAHARACAACDEVVRREIAQEERLDRLLARWAVPAAPDGLARRVLTRLEPARAHGVGPADAELDELLERDAGIAAPDGLAARVLAGLAPERPALVPPRSRRFRRVALAAAAVAVLVFVARSAWRSGGREGPLLAPRPESASEDSEPSGSELSGSETEELLVYALERWDLLHDDDLDVWLASLDPVDELLVELVDGELDGAGNGSPDGKRE